jgi:hypothetical protein
MVAQISVRNIVNNICNLVACSSDESGWGLKSNVRARGGRGCEKNMPFSRSLFPVYNTLKWMKNLANIPITLTLVISVRNSCCVVVSFHSVLKCLIIETKNRWTFVKVIFCWSTAAVHELNKYTSFVLYKWRGTFWGEFYLAETEKNIEKWEISRNSQNYRMSF